MFESTVPDLSPYHPITTQAKVRHSSWSIYFDPDQSQLLVESEISALGQVVHMEDIYGRVMVHQRVTASRVNFSIEHLPPGIYRIKLACHGSRRWIKT